MDEQMRKLGNEVAKQSAEKCINCNHKCFMYIVFTYVSENGYEHFIYHYEHNSLPQEVAIAFKKFMQIFGTFIAPETYTLITIPWCNVS